MLSLITVMILASLGAGLVQLHTSIDRRHEFAIDRRRALYLAEAGIGEAALAVSQGKSGNIASEAVPAAFGGGVYWVEADDLPDDRVVLRCTAQVATAEFVVRSMILPNVNPVTRLGFFGSDGMTVGWGSTVDGYHSGQGTFASQVDPSLGFLSTGRMGLLGSDADIRLDETEPSLPSGDALRSAGDGAPSPPWGSLVAAADEMLPRADADADSGADSGDGSADAPATVPTTTSPTRIFGRIRPGSSSRVQSGGRSIIQGEIVPFDAPPPLPAVTLPTPRERLTGTLTIEADQTNIGAEVETWVEEDVIVTAGARVTIEGPAVLRCRSLALEERSALILDDSNGPIHLYTEEGFDFRFGSGLHSPADEVTARGTYLFVAGSAGESDRVVLDCEGTFHGAIYAPEDIIRVPDELRVLGSVVARVVVTEPGTHITYDRRLGLGGDGVPALPRQLSWQVVPLGDEVARRLRLNPLVRLALNGVTPVPSGLGAIEVDVELQYVDLAGNAASYRGALAGFDPTVSTRIVGARWTDPRDGEVRTWTTPVGHESTGALAEIRRSLQAVRATLQTARPDTDVATLSDADALLEVTLNVTGTDLATAPDSVQWAAQRVDATEVSLTPDPAETATRAATTAREYADLAASKRAEASLLPIALSDILAAALKNDLNRAEDDAARAANDAESKATLAQTLVGDAQVAAAEEAAAFSQATIDATLRVLDLFSQLEALSL